MTFAQLLDATMKKHVPSTHGISGRMTGHLGGDFIEEKSQEFLADLGAVRTHVFLNNRIQELWTSKKFRSVGDLMAYLDLQWWWQLNSRTLAQLKAYVIDGVALEYKQQDTSDLVVVRDGTVHLINVKSHDLGRESRAPNIISTNKVLEFYEWAASLPSDLKKKTLAEAEVYFLSVSWREEADGIALKGAYVRRLSRLDVSKIPQLNFDAALQIQWHVEAMVEKDQTPMAFARELALRTQTDFARHIKQKTTKFQRFADNLSKDD